MRKRIGGGARALVGGCAPPRWALRPPSRARCPVLPPFGAPLRASAVCSRAPGRAGFPPALRCAPPPRLFAHSAPPLRPLPAASGGVRVRAVLRRCSPAARRGGQPPAFPPRVATLPPPPLLPPLRGARRGGRAPAPSVLAPGVPRAPVRSLPGARCAPARPLPCALLRVGRPPVLPARPRRLRRRLRAAPLRPGGRARASPALPGALRPPGLLCARARARTGRGERAPAGARGSCALLSQRITPAPASKARKGLDRLGHARYN